MKLFRAEQMQPSADKLIKSKRMDHMFMDMAYTVAHQSSDSHRQVGAVIVKDEQVLGYGYNGTPTGWHTNECKKEDGTTKAEVVHAEINAICKAAAHGGGINGATMYSTTIPCIECAKAIIQSGIKRVVYREPYNKCSKGIDALKQVNLIVDKLGTYEMK